MEKTIGAVDIGGTKTAVGIVDENGRVLGHREAPTEPEKGVAEGLSRISGLLQSILTETGTSVKGIGVGCTGRHNIEAGILGDVEAFLPGWEGAPIASRLSGDFSVPVVLENDADAAALGESTWGAGKNTTRFIYLTVSTGIGGGLVFDGALYRGVGGAHPEIGHHTIEQGGVQCFCGAYGCWENLASGPAMARWWLENHPEARFKVGQGDARQICDLARLGNQHAQNTVARESRYLGIGLANLITLFAPDVIALGGGVMRSWDLFEAGARAVIRQNCGLVPFEKVKITSAILGAEVVLAGAAAAWALRFP